MGKVNELYEMTEEYLILDEQLALFFYQQQEKEAISEEDQVRLDGILERMNALEGKIEEQAENIAKLIRWRKALAQVQRQEEERIARRRKASESAAEWMTQALYANLKAAGKEKFKTALFTFTIAKNGGKQPLKITENLDEIPGKYLIPQPPKPNTEAIRELLAEKEVEWAHLEPRGESLRIR